MATRSWCLIKHCFCVLLSIISNRKACQAIKRISSISSCCKIRFHSKKDWKFANQEKNAIKLRCFRIGMTNELFAISRLLRHFDYFVWNRISSSDSWPFPVGHHNNAARTYATRAYTLFIRFFNVYYFSAIWMEYLFAFYHETTTEVPVHSPVYL